MAYSDNGQEEWILEVFGADFVGTAADVGANDGRFLSNTLGAEDRGWQVLCVEANPQYEHELTSCRSLVEICACGSRPSPAEPFYVNEYFPPGGSALIKNPGFLGRTIEIEVPVFTLNTLLEKHGFQSLDLLSVDVEHTELEVLKGFDFPRWHPRALLIEAQSDAEEHAITAHVTPFGYRRVARFFTDIAYLKEPHD